MAKQGYPVSGTRYGGHPGVSGYPASGARYGSHPDGAAAFTNLFLGGLMGHSQGAGPVETPSPNTWPDNRVKLWTEFLTDVGLQPAATQLIGNVTAGLDLTMWSGLADTYPTSTFGLTKVTRTGSRASDWLPTANGGTGVMDTFATLANTMATTLRARYPGVPETWIVNQVLGEADALGSVTQASFEANMRTVMDFLQRNLHPGIQFILRKINDTFNPTYPTTPGIQAGQVALAATEYRVTTQDGGDAASMVPWDWILSTNPHFSFEPRLDSSDGVTMRQGLRLIGQHTYPLVTAPPGPTVSTGNVALGTIVTSVTIKDYWESTAAVSNGSWPATIGGHDLSEATNPPTLGTDAGINGQNCYTFDGTNDILSNASVDCAVGDCVIGLVRITNPATTNQSLWGGSTAAAACTAYVQTAGSIRAFNGTNGTQQTIPTDTWVVVFCSYRNTTRDFMRSRDKSFGRANGTACGSAAATGWRLGGRGATAVGFLAGKIAAVARFNGEPTPVEVAGIINKWRAIYGTSFVF